MKKLFVAFALLALLIHYINTQEAKTPSVVYGGHGSPVNSTFFWPIIRQEQGVLIYKEDSGYKNYLFVVDTSQNKVTIQNVFAEMDKHWNQAGNPICVFNAGFFEPGGEPSFPVIENRNIIPGAVTGKYPAKILYINGEDMYMQGVWSNLEVQGAEWGMSGLDTTFYEGDQTVTNRTVVGIKGNLLYIFVTQTYTIDELVGLYANPNTIGIEQENVLALDSGYSSQVRCFGEDFLSSPSVMGSTLIVSKR